MKSVLAMLLAAAAALAGSAKQISSYDIRVELTPQHGLNGTETLTWWNDSPDTVATLQFHLYLNAFKNSQSTFFRESGGRLRSDRAEGDHWGWIDVTRMKLRDGADLTKSIRFIQPDDGNAGDQTVIEAQLPEPVRPGQTIQLEIDFKAQLPKVYARTGFHGQFHLAGQWFPKIGVWETAGMRGRAQAGWNCHQFHAHSEFYSNFGRYRVRLTVPSAMVVGATGEMRNKESRPEKNTTTYTFEQEDVTDFAWTAQPDFLRMERMFEAAKECTPEEVKAAADLHGIPEEEARLSDVKMILLLQPEHRAQAERHFKALRAGLKWFGLWYGRYPYKTITVVDPPYGGGGAGGMEYPTFITAGTMYSMPEDVNIVLEEVVVHEFGHQFWKELVATNEFEESPLDEGFNTYSTSRIMDKVFGKTAMPLPVFGMNAWSVLGLPKLGRDSVNRAASFSGVRSDSLIRPAWQYYDSSSYGINSYMRTHVALRTLEGLLGERTFARAMRKYHQTWRFGHPCARDFQAVVNEVSGRDMNWFFDQFFHGTRLLDYAVGEVSVSRRGNDFGQFDKGSGKILVSREDAGKKDEQDEKAKKGKQWESIVKIVRREDAAVPVEIEIRFDDGHVERKYWDGSYRWVRYNFIRAAKVAGVEVDPKRKLQLDLSFANNSWQEKYNSTLSTRWLGQVLFWAQNLALWMSAGM
jgi:hypothetical protein